MWLILILVGILSYFYYKFSTASNFWKRYGVPLNKAVSQLERLQVFIGFSTQANLDEKVYKDMGSDKYCGVMEFTDPLLLVKDLELVKKVLIKDFDHFVDRRNFGSNDNQKVIDKMLFNMEGAEWKGVRAALSPTFTTGKIRRMMGIFNNISHDWIRHFKEEVKKGGGNKVGINIEKEAINYTVESIAAAVFGMKAGTIENPKSGFAIMAKRLVASNVVALLKFLLIISFPKVSKVLKVPLFDHEAFEFFTKILNQGIKARREGGGSAKQNDFLQLLIEASKGTVKAVGEDDLDRFEKEAQIESGDKKNWLNDDDTISASMLQFFTAGFSTTSNFIGLALYMLTLNPEVQKKLREEVDSQLFNKEGEDIDYDELGKLQYLDMVVCETLRKFPVLARLERKCVRDYKDPESGMACPKGVIVGIPVQAIHNDKEFYERPDDFYPEHFSPENKAKRSPYTYLPFGSGPRNCIGMRFALIEGKAAIAHVVHNFILEPTTKTPVPMALKNVGIGVQIVDDLEIGFRLAK